MNDEMTAAGSQSEAAQALLVIEAAVNALPELVERVKRLEAENTALKDLCLAAGDLYKGGGVFPIKGTMALRLLKAGAALNQEPGQ